MLVPKVVVTESSPPSEALLAELERLSLCGPVLLALSGGVADAEPADPAEAWRVPLWRFPLLVGPFEASEVGEDAAGRWLNRGAQQVVFEGVPAVVARALRGAYPRERVQVRFRDAELEDVAEEGVLKRLGEVCAGVRVRVEGEASKARVREVAATAWEIFGRKLMLTLEIDEPSGEDGDFSELVGELHAMHSRDDPILICSAVVSVPGSEETKPFCVGRSFISCLQTDRGDGLFATVVCDEAGVALGLVYSSPESIVASLASGRGVYWSRSRRTLWRKGDTSGAFQELVSISFDCDGDALRFKVRQRGDPPAFCHRHTRTCWGFDGGVGSLYRTLESRKRNAPQGSYTKRLFEDRGLLRNKLIEESQEVIEAVEEQDREHVAEETADLAYFLFTAAVAGGATLEEIHQQLDMRSLKVKRRPGNAKEDRMKVGDEVLKELEAAKKEES